MSSAIMGLLASALSCHLALICTDAIDCQDAEGDRDSVARFARVIEAAFSAKTSDTISRIVDWDQLYSRGTRGLQNVEGLRDAYSKRWRDLTLRETGILGQIRWSVCAANGSFKFLREVEPKVLLFRCLRPDGYSAYYKFLVGSTSDGNLAVIDVLNFADMSWSSEGIRWNLLPLSKKTANKNLEPWERALLKHVESVVQIEELKMAGRYADALEVYRGLPATLRDTRKLLFLRLEVAQGLGAGHKEAAEAIADIVRVCRDDTPPGILFDFHFAKKEYKLALQCLERESRMTHSDPFVDAVRALVLMRMGDNDSAREMADSAVRKLPKEVSVYRIRLQVALQERDYKTVVDFLIRLERECSWMYESIEKAEIFKGFIRSPEYKEYKKWVESRGK